MRKETGGRFFLFTLALLALVGGLGYLGYFLIEIRQHPTVPPSLPSAFPEPLSSVAQEPTGPVTLSTVSSTSETRSVSPERPSGKRSIAERVLEGAKKELAKKTVYKETYEVLAYPMGDVPADIGVCTDLVIRAFRNADIDLQKLLHEDRIQHPDKYPTHLWDNRKADKNIDHRRCQNLVVFFQRFAQSLDKNDPASWKPGDVIFVIWGKRDYPTHVGIISDRRNPDGSPILCHLYPPYCHEASVADYGPVYGVYRWSEDKKVVQANS